MSVNTGKVKQVMGPVVDVEFESGNIPNIYNALLLTNTSISNEKDNLVVEVANTLVIMSFAVLQ